MTAQEFQVLAKNIIQLCPPSSEVYLTGILTGMLLMENELNQGRIFSAVKPNYTRLLERFSDIARRHTENER